MTERAITWLQAHPLEGVCLLAGAAIVFALALIPGMALISRHGHPRC